MECRIVVWTFAIYFTSWAAAGVAAVSAAGEARTSGGTCPASVRTDERVTLEAKDLGHLKALYIRQNVKVSGWRSIVNCDFIRKTFL